MSDSLGLGDPLLIRYGSSNVDETDALWKSISRDALDPDVLVSVVVGQTSVCVED
jgi:hypothetical protein